MLAKEVARRVRSVDYRAVAASSFLGLGSVWAQGLLRLGGAADGHLDGDAGGHAHHRGRQGSRRPGQALVAGGIIPLSHTIFLWQSVVSVIIEIAVVTTVVYLYAPPAGARARPPISASISAPRRSTRPRPRGRAGRPEMAGARARAQHPVRRRRGRLPDWLFPRRPQRGSGHLAQHHQPGAAHLRLPPPRHARALCARCGRRRPACGA